MLEPFKRRALLLKIEGDEGVDSEPTPQANAFELFDGRAGITGDIVERPKDRPFFTNDPFTVANPRSFVEGYCEIVPPAAPGANPAAVDVLLQIGGMARTLVAADPGPPEVLGMTRYNVISSGIPSATAYWYHAGTFRKVLGTRAGLTGLAMEIGNYLRVNLRIEGSYVDVDEAELPTELDYAAFGTPRVCSTESMTLLLDGFAVDGKSLSIDFGSQQVTIEHTEARINRINDRRPTFAARAYRAALEDLDPWARWKVGSIIPLVAIHEELDGRQTRILTRGQIESIEEVDIDGDYGIELRGRCIASDAGNDEIVIEFIAPPVP